MKKTTLTTEKISLDRPMFGIDRGHLSVAIGEWLTVALPRGVSPVFQKWNAGSGSIALPSALLYAKWPDDYAVAALVRSVDIDEIFALLNEDVPQNERVCRIAPFQYGPSMSVGDVVAINDGLPIELMRCEPCGWSVVELLTDYC